MQEGTRVVRNLNWHSSVFRFLNSFFPAVLRKISFVNLKILLVLVAAQDYPDITRGEIAGVGARQWK